MLYAVPRSIFSWGFEVYLDNDLLAVIDMAWVREGGDFSHEGCNYQLRKEQMFSGNFSIESDGKSVATASKTAFVRSFEIRTENQAYTLKAVSPFTRSFVLEQDGHVVGRISPNHPFTRKCVIDLPQELSIAARLFIFWLVLLMWRRAASNNAG
jgi:hypothetical protein